MHICIFCTVYHRSLIIYAKSINIFYIYIYFESPGGRVVQRDGYSAGDLVSRYLSSMGLNPGEGRTKNLRKQIYRSNIVGLMFRRVVYTLKYIWLKTLCCLLHVLWLFLRLGCCFMDLYPSFPFIHFNIIYIFILRLSIELSIYVLVLFQWDLISNFFTATPFL